jgi:hypothetical protein
VAGSPTTEYRATIDLDKVSSEVPARNRVVVQQTIQALESMAHIKRIPIDVWIDKGSLVRELAMQMHMSLPSGQSIAMSLQLTIPQYGPQPKPTLPPASQVTDLTSLQGLGTSTGASG